MTAPTRPDPFWRNRAVCRDPGADPDWWVLDSTKLTDQNLWALRVCGRCPVSRQCLDTARALRMVEAIVAGRPVWQEADLWTGERRAAA